MILSFAACPAATTGEYMMGLINNPKLEVSTMPGSADAIAKTAVKEIGEKAARIAVRKAGCRFSNRLPTQSHPERQRRTRHTIESKFLAVR